MKRTLLNYWIAVAMFALMLGIALIGVLLGFVIPRGEGFSASRKQLWGMGRHDWGNVHLWLAIAFLVVLVVHIVLHWSWIVTTTRNVCRRGRQAQGATSS